MFTFDSTKGINAGMLTCIYRSRSSVWVRKMSQIWEILKELKLVEYREGDLSGFMKDFVCLEIEYTVYYVCFKLQRTYFIDVEFL